MASCTWGCQGGGGAPTEEPIGETSTSQLSQTFPSDGEVGVPRGSSVRAVFSLPMEPSTVNEATFYLEFGEGSQAAGTVSMVDSFTAVFLPSSPLRSSTLYTAVLTDLVRDALGRPFPGARWSFATVDDKGPTVDLLSPPCGSKGVEVDTSFCAYFSEPLDPATVTSGTFFLIDEGPIDRPGGPGGGPGQRKEKIQGRLTVSGAAVCFQPDAPLKTDNQYRLSIRQGIQDLAGNNLEEGLLCDYLSKDAKPPTVKSTKPADGSENVDPETEVWVKFSEAIFFESLTDATVLFQDAAAQPVGHQRSYDQTTFVLTLKPDKDLPHNEQLKITLKKEITDASGNPLGKDFQFGFATGTGWTPPELVEQDNSSNARNPQLAVNPSTGVLHAIWEQQGANDTAIRIYANEYVPGTGWKTPTPLCSGNIAATEPRLLLISATGSVFAGYIDQKPSDSFPSVYVSRRLQGSGGWDAEGTLLSDGLAAASALEIAVGTSNDDLFAVWLERSPANSDVRINVYETRLPASGAPDPILRISDDFKASNWPDVAVEPASGNVVVAYTEQLSGQAFVNVNSAIFRFGSWNLNIQVGNDAAAQFSPQVVADPISQVFRVVFRESDLAYEAALQAGNLLWDTQVQVSDGARKALDPGIVLDEATGSAIAYWIETGGGQKDNLWVSANPFGGGWLPEVRVSNDGGKVTVPYLAVDPKSQKVLAVWVEKNTGDTSPNIYASRGSTNGGTWSSLVRLSTNAGTTDKPQAADFSIGGVFQAAVVWQESDGTRTNILAAHFQ